MCVLKPLDVIVDHHIVVQAVAPRLSVVSSDAAANSGSFSGFPPGESTVLLVRLNILLMCCVSEVHSHEDIMLRVLKGESNNKHSLLSYRIIMKKHDIHPL